MYVCIHICNIVILLLMPSCVWVFCLIYVCVSHMWPMQWRPEKGVRSHGTRITVMRAMWVLRSLEPKFWKSSNVFVRWAISLARRNSFIFIVKFTAVFLFWGSDFFIVSKCSQVSRAQRIFESWNYSIWYNGLYILLYICSHKMCNT